MNIIVLLTYQLGNFLSLFLLFDSKSYTYKKFLSFTHLIFSEHTASL